MPHLLIIRLKALFLLTVFAANFCAICHCGEMVVTRHTLAHTNPTHKNSCCQESCRSANSDATPHKPCNEQGGCCGAHAIKFGLLEKQTVEPIHIDALFAVAITPYFIVSPEIPLPGHVQGHIGYEWRHKHSPPDLQSLYQRFLI